ncbi:hypothetical protein RND71_030220 [Anisodus tanguticus]|uniref:AAA+ ATPase domain-containing protein n=1 Tax=Anisodus tanguticus TaxID=243964 RepID=A0AAE1RHA7_9SOLA|nr:hypothetical protein RND71_030220 [Anisodus tanguticus]
MLRYINAELYQQTLAKALVHHFDAKLLLLDLTDFFSSILAYLLLILLFHVSIIYRCRASMTSSRKFSFQEVNLRVYVGTFVQFARTFLEAVKFKGQTTHHETKKCKVQVIAEVQHLSFMWSSAATELMICSFIHIQVLFSSFAVTYSRQTAAFDTKSRNREGASNSLKHRRTASVSSDISSISSESSSSNPAPIKRVNSWSLDEKVFLQSLFKILVSISETSHVILYIRDVDRHLQSPRVYNLFDRMLKKLSGSVLVLGSRMFEHEDDCEEVDEKLGLLFPYNIEIRPPEDETHLTDWKTQLEVDMKMIQFQDNKNHIAEVLAANDLECDDLGSICQADRMVLSNYIEEIVNSAISYHLMNSKDPEYRNGKLLISSNSLSHGLSVFQDGKSGCRDSLKMEANADLSKDTPVDDIGIKPETESESKGEAEKSGPSTKKDGEISSASKAPEVIPDNEFEKRIRPEVIPSNEIGVTFADIGALDETKESLQELVMLPLKRPDLFNGGLLKPCRGILLFGPPGTGKTMLAKAIANEAGASFINVSMSTITSKWFGEDEKNVRALFTLAAKESPTIIFVDEVDSMLGQRTRVGEHEAMRKIKNEFMTHWDGLLTKPGECILVLAATNRPFDLDEAIIRRFECRIMVGLPAAENREKILRTLLAKEKVEDLDFKELAAMTEGYSGSDLKEKKRRAEEGQSAEGHSDEKEEAPEERVML